MQQTTILQRLATESKFGDLFNYLIFHWVAWSTAAAIVGFDVLKALIPRNQRFSLGGLSAFM